MRHTNYFKLTPENREREIQIRRKMLVAHQFLGFVTLGTMVGSAVTGQIMISTNSGRTQEKIKPIHKALTTSTIISYTTTALLQMLAPPPIIIRKNKGWSNVKAHRTLAYIHFTGMVLTPIAGQLMYGSASLKNDKSDQLRKFHQVAGYFTTGLFASAVLVMKF
jgi:cytochrome b561